jgi:hypothetical protein
LLDVNALSGPTHNIEFAIPAGQQAINLLTPLPAPTNALTVWFDATQNVVLSSTSAWNNNGSLALSGEGALTLGGGIAGTGNLTTNAGSHLTASYIVQGALVIGGTAGNSASVTIAASDTTGNPLTDAAAMSMGPTMTSRQLAAPIAISNPSIAAASISSIMTDAATPSTALKATDATRSGGFSGSALAANARSSDSASRIALRPLSEFVGASGTVNSTSAETKWLYSHSPAIVSSMSGPWVSRARQAAVVANRMGALLNPDAVAAAFDNADILEWVASTPVRRPSAADADISLMADDLLEAIGQQWRN